MQNLIEFLYSKFLLSNGVSTDTRSLQEGDLFFALSGPNFNGNKFAEEALEKGASFVIIDDPEFVGKDKTLLVENSLNALQELSVFHRKRFRKPVIALTGSNGKTTTKELIAKVLSQKYDVLATEGNLNNHIGVPLTLLKIHPQVEIAVIEMGASKVGDIAELCSYALPTHGLITNIGYAHTETFGGIEGVLRGKTELFDFLRKTKGKVFVNQLDPRLMHLNKRFEEPILYPEPGIEAVENSEFLGFSIDGDSYQTNLTGAYNFMNIAAAISVGRFFEVPELKIAKSIEGYEPDNWRSQIVNKGSIKVIVDAYNANPDSMRAALENFAKMEGPKAVFLGDMLELQDAEKAHEELGQYIASLKIDKVLLVGDLMKSASAKVPGSEHFDSREDLLVAIKDSSFENFRVLLKGSRKMRLEELVDAIE